MNANLKHFAALYEDFAVELSPSLLLQTMANYNLKAEDVTGDYTFDSQLFEQKIAQFTLNDGVAFQEKLKSSLSIVSNWSKKLSWQQFNQHINRLLTSWLEDYKSTASQDHIFILAQCLKLLPVQTKPSPDLFAQLKFQSLLIHLIARTTNQFDQYQYEYSQNFDLKTNLPNQHLLLHLLKQRLAKQHEKMHLGLILLNLNINFHEEPQLNTVSNKIIHVAIDMIQRHLNDETTLFHVGSAELAIVVEHLKFPAQMNLITSQLIHTFEFALPLENITLILKPYLGGVSTFTATSNAMGMVGCARLALHHAMLNNHQIEIYDPFVNTSFSKINQLEEAVIKALQQNELEVFLQPIISLPLIATARETCTSAELLLRWKSEDWPAVPPTRLIDIIYKKGFGKIFIRWLINNACQRSAELRTIHPFNLSLTINLCASDLLDADLPELIAQSIKLWDIPAKNLTLEITESDLLVDEAKAALVIEKIVLLGCKLALDDFGTGYSSMTRLRNMPIDLVKIDQSFVRNIENSKEDREIVQSIIQLSHSLNKTVVAEGVEDNNTLSLLKMMQCEKIQGDYYAKPMPFNEFNRWLQSFDAK